MKWLKILVVNLLVMLFFPCIVYAEEKNDILHVDVQKEDGSYVLWKEEEVYKTYGSLCFSPKLVREINENARIMICTKKGKEEVYETPFEGEQFRIMLPLFEEVDLWFYADVSENHRIESRHYHFRRMPDERLLRGIRKRRISGYGTFNAPKNMID